MRKVVYVTSEAAPYASSGGLGDVMGSLPGTVKRMLSGEASVSVVLPLYADIRRKYGEQLKPVYEGTFYLAWRRIQFRVFGLCARGVDYFFVEHPRYFDRPAMYGEFDDGERFAFFGRAVIEFLLGTSRVPDVLHANDWQTALSLIYLKTLYANDARTASIHTVLTVHNLEYQGKFSLAILSDVLDLHPSQKGIVEYDGCLNLLKGGMTVAERVTTVSPRYAEEITSAPFGQGLAPFLSSLSRPVLGILNGIDLSFFNPSDKKSLRRPYGVSSIEAGKTSAKEEIAELLSFPLQKEAPLLLAVTRLSESKGIPLLLEALPGLLSLGTQFILLGSGEPRYEQAFRELQERNRENVRVIFQFDRELSKKLYASADIFLMPSRSEPCGLSQMIACRYGTVPVVRSTGGLADSIVPFGHEGGCGFVFSAYRSGALFDAVADAVAFYRADRKKWDALRRSGMKKDFSWKCAAEKYISLYRELWEDT